MSQASAQSETRPGSSSLLRERQRLAAELQRLRVAAGLSTYQLAESLGVSQSKVSKIEHSRVAVSATDARAWAIATGVPAAGVEEIVQQAVAALTDTVGRSSLRSLTGGLAERQREIAQLEQQAAAIRSFDLLVVPGLLQTAEYARRIFLRGQWDEREVPNAVAARMDRQAVLYEGDREFEMLVSEVVLRSMPERAVALAQLDRLRSVMTLPNLRLGLVPIEAVGWPWQSHGFALYEGREEGEDVVHVETLTAVLNISDPEDVEIYRTALRRLRAVAVEGEAAAAAIERVMREIVAR